MNFYYYRHPVRWLHWALVQTALYGRWAVFGRRNLIAPNMVRYRKVRDWLNSKGIK